MQKSVQDVLKKINYIEAEIEIQKQILHSIPDNCKQDIEDVIKKIAAGKKDIEGLREELAAISPEEYTKLISIEEAVISFKKIAAEGKFKEIESMSTDATCAITLKNRASLPCLVKARDDKGNWTIITPEGELLQFAAEEVSTEHK